MLRRPPPRHLGLPFPSTEIRVVDADALDAGDLRDAEPSEASDDGVRTVRGELLVRGPQVFRGYWNRPEETAHQLLDDGWLRTGDVVRVALDGPDAGLVTLVDRIKEMIVTGGFKVYPSQVEEHLRGMPGVRDVAVVGVPGSGSDEHVAAVVVLDDADDAASPPRVDLAAVREWGEKRLARYALPARSPSCRSCRARRSARCCAAWSARTSWAATTSSTTAPDYDAHPHAERAR